MTIGKKIKKYRTEQHMTQKTLGEITGIAEITIRQYEANKYSPKIENLKKIAGALNADLENFIDIGKAIKKSKIGDEEMRKLKLIKVVVPEIVAYIGSDKGIENMEPDYRCTECGFGVAEEYVCCPYCAAELDWKRVRKPTKKFRKLISRL